MNLGSVDLRSRNCAAGELHANECGERLALAWRADEAADELAEIVGGQCAPCPTQSSLSGILAHLLEPTVHGSSSRNGTKAPPADAGGVKS